MPGVPQIIQMRERQRSRARRNPRGWIVLTCSTLASLFAALGIIILALAYTSLSKDLPSLESLPALVEPPNGLLLQPTRLYDRTGEHVLLTLQNPAAAGRQYLAVERPSSPPDNRPPAVPDDPPPVNSHDPSPVGLYDPPAAVSSDRPAVASHDRPAVVLPGAKGDSHERFLPGTLISATIATVDPTFWSNPGFSLQGIRQGSHPTLAQHLVTDLLLVDEPPGMQRALRERLLAAQITARFGKAKLLVWYLNNAYYGHLAYGADAASRVYFDKPAYELSLAEAALLAAVSRDPALNPLDAAPAALERQKQVIEAMLDQGLITRAQANRARGEKLVFRPASEAELLAAGRGPSLAPAFTSLVLEQLSAEIGRSRLERGGLRIITTLDYNLQLQADCAAATQIRRLQSDHTDQPAADGSACEAARLLPTLPGAGPLDLQLEANVAVLHPLTGRILALVGRPSSGLEALPAHPTGSLLTPFIYLTGFTRGLSPASLVWDTPNDSSAAGEVNFDGQFQGPLRLRMAMANDYLTPAAKIQAQVGSENVLHTARQFGLSPVQQPAGNGSSSQAWELGNVSLLKVSQAFGVFANQGILAGREVRPDSSSQQPGLGAVAVEKVEDNTGKTWLDWSNSESRPVIVPQLAYLVTHVLSDETARWPSLGHPNPLEIGRPAAAKIGRTLGSQDVWTVGFTPQLVVGVWLGKDASQSKIEETSGPSLAGEVPFNAAAALWHAVIQYASRSQPPDEWPVPLGVTTLEVCDPSGLLPTPDCPAVVNEVFLAGSEPTQADTYYRRLEINRETGRLATVFTPSELVEERVFLMVPPEAREWASLAGLSTPPEAYDAVPPATATSPDVQITSPAMFAYVKGKVPILGKASGEDFDYYRVQVGNGLNPSAWLQVGQNVSRPVNSGQLVAWDTTGLDGLYAVQLLVVRQDQRVDSAVIQVAVDNQSPEVSILYPLEGQKVSAARAGTVTLRASAADNLALKSVQFSVDGHPIVALSHSPYTSVWQASSGTHVLQVKATDMAGNTSETKATFVVEP